jgi:hypothetical protein
MHGFLWRAFGLGLATLIVGSVLVVSLYQSSQVEPEFYTQALTVNVETQQQASEEFVAAAEEVAEQIESNSGWETSITEEQLNGWLAIDLQKMLSDRGISGIEEPRCRIQVDGIRLACRWQASGLGGVLVLHCQPELDAEHERLTVSIRSVKSGILPVPRSRWLEPLRATVESSELPVSWGTDQEPPTISVDLSRVEAVPGRKLLMEQMELQDGVLKLSGSSTAVATPE